MPMLPLVGHRAQRGQVSSAIVKERLPQLLLLTGQEGVGKQRFGLWIAQRLLCEGPAGEPCGSCRQCRLVLALSHPDVHWFFPVPRPKSGEPDKQVEELETALNDQLQERRMDPVYGAPEGLAGHFVATARLINRHAMLRPAEGQVQVFLIGYADRLVPQEASPEAANALLKLLEEPPRGAYFILTAVDSEAVLPTIRSRAVTMALGPLSNDEVRAGLASVRPDLTEQELGSLVVRAEGSIGHGLADSPESEATVQMAGAMLEAARGNSAAGWEMALKQTPFSARGDFTGTLDAMAELLVNASRSGSKSGAAGALKGVPASRLLLALERVGAAREMAQNNVNPQVLLAVLNQELSEIL